MIGLKNERQEQKVHLAQRTNYYVSTFADCINNQSFGIYSIQVIFLVLLVFLNYDFLPSRQLTQSWFPGKNPYIEIDFQFSAFLDIIYYLEWFIKIVWK